jgi:hypothetical protein
VTPADPEAAALVHFLDAQRASVLAIVDGLDEDALHAATLPSGWTPLGLIEHLGNAERFWFQAVAAGAAPDPPDPPGPEPTTGTEEPSGAHRRSPQTVFAYYRGQCRRANDVLTSTPLSSPPLGQHGLELEDDVTNLRWIALHMIEETSRHAGHLDVVRELLDGRTGLGPR